MSIKLVTVDMDGTFLGDQKVYNRECFIAQYRQMKEQGIRFVVASSNQYYQLISLFPELVSGTSFVAENGGRVISEGGGVFNGRLAKDDSHAIVDHLLTRADIDIIVHGKNNAYTSKRYSDEHKSVSAMYYHRLKFVDSSDNLNDVLSKPGLNTLSDRIPQVQADLHEAIGGIMVLVHIDCGSIDLIIPDVRKANGLRLLQRRWSISDDEVATFGDGENDIKMLCQAGFSFAMVNAHEPVIEAVRYRAGSNNEEGVLDTIDHVSKNEAPLTH